MLDTLITFFSRGDIQIALVAGGLGLLLGYLIASLRSQPTIRELSIDNARLSAKLDGDQRHFEEQLELLQKTRAGLSQEFAQLSQRALRNNNGLFLRLAEQSLKIQSARSVADLEQRQQSIEHLLTPIRETLEKTQHQLHQIEKEREHSFGALSEQLKLLAGSEQALRSETRNLVHALKRPDTRGRWGEMSLKRLAELAGMIEHCDFQEQVQQNGATQTLRPDMVVKLPDARQLIVDAKAPLDAYLAAIDADTEEEEKHQLQRHARQLRQRFMELAKKQYWAQFEQTPDFVIMFVPGDSFLNSALQQDPSLLEDAMQSRVILATPSSLVALLRAVAFGWRQQQFSRNAEIIRDLGQTLVHRISTLTEHLGRLGKSLNSSVEHYNKTVGSMERQVLPAAEKMSELGIETSKHPKPGEPVEKAARQPVSRSPKEP
ncbi:MAG: DNA recombination protein RmuC [bacterium]